MHQSLLVLVVLAASATSLHAQGARLIGLTRDTGILRTLDPDTCARTERCRVEHVLPLKLPWEGGTAFDSTTGGVWVGAGQLLVKVDPQTCELQCGPLPVVDQDFAPVFPVVTGLAMSESTGELLVIDSAGTLTRLQVRGCPPPLGAARCDTGLRGPNTASTTGLAVDEARSLVFISEADFATGASRIAVTRLGGDCAIFQTEELTSCGDHPLGPVTGLAVDWCEQVLWATDGRHTVALKYGLAPSGADPRLVFEPVGCCLVDTGAMDPLVGLALTPRPVRPFGQSCSNGTCQPCSAMVHEVLNGPTVGNPNLVFAVEGAKVSEPIWLVLGAGPCGVGPQPFPLCGPLLVGVSDVRPVAIGPFRPEGNAECTGRVSLQVHVPMLPELCGSIWSSQWIQLCIDPFVSGTAMSNCVSFELGS